MNMAFYTRIYRYLLLFFIVITVNITTINAQNNRPYYFKNFSIKDGLAQNTVHHMIQDKRGFIWFATKEGASRFEGVSFQIGRAAGREQVWGIV